MWKITHVSPIDRQWGGIKTEASDMAGGSLGDGECLPFNMNTAKVFYHIAHVYNRTDLT